MRSLVIVWHYSVCIWVARRVVVCKPSRPTVKG